MSLQLNKTYKYVGTIGSGADASVVKVRDKKTDIEYAMKVVKISSISDFDMYSDYLPLESRLLIDLVGVDGVVQVERVFRERPLFFGKLKDDDSFCTVMQMPPTKYYSLDMVDIKLNSTLRKIFARLIAALKEVDDRGIAQMDIHAGNVLVEEKDLRVTVIDFGRAQYKSRPYHFQEQVVKWSEHPPELTADDFSLFDYDLYTPWEIAKLMFTFYKPKGKGKTPSIIYPDLSKFPNIPPMLKDLFSKVFVPYTRRIRLRQFFEHPYFDLSQPEDYSKVKDQRVQ